MKLLILIALGGSFKLSLGLFFISSIILGFMTKLRKLIMANKVKSLVYALFIIVTFGITGLISSGKVLNDIPFNSFFAFQIVFMILGIIHFILIRKFFEELSSSKSNFISEFLFTVAFMCIGLIAFTNVINLFKSPYSVIFMTASIVFIIPLLAYKMYEFALQIPVPIFDQWSFPNSKEIKDPTKDELANPKVISFEFKKSITDTEITNFKVKAPEGMVFGKLFYFFIVDYNARHPENTIEFENNTIKEPYDWSFYYKKKWWAPANHIDFSKTIFQNNIKEDTVIICNRIH